MTKSLAIWPTDWKQPDHSEEQPGRCESLIKVMNRAKVLNGGPSSAIFEQAKAITRFIQRFGTPVT